MLEKQKVGIHTNAHMDGQCSTVEVTSPLITHMMLLDTYVHIFILAQHTRFDGRRIQACILHTHPHTNAIRKQHYAAFFILLK